MVILSIFILEEKVAILEGGKPLGVGVGDSRDWECEVLVVCVLARYLSMTQVLRK